ncbi:glucosaminidase domain-containing protein [Kordiimonas sp. SCSIO 12610]|uniref:glucosaminidase domain-containing protein n=1 Tax=Kordiimonas sp. SCSIO 12610 TaxID=2829597 RepID=UPI00210BFD73|nr:glucosaminidase domain-containing protein [Kordiimonas sp. SCSIO 12610]UTW54277.1 glucosaminidase domain-containing protein [Kordiimonas sp. SCSIO 12610]
MKVISRYIGIIALVALFIVLPIFSARYFLQTARITSLEQGTPNYLAHESPPKSTEEVNNKLAGVLAKNFQNIEAIPRVFLTRLPESLPEIENTAKRKQLFISTMLPLILRSNELILADRKTALKLKRKINRGYLLRATERDWIHGLFRKYLSQQERAQIALQPSETDIDRLLYKLDTIPPSLAMAQAAIESGWGSSYFSQEGNALFGQWVWDDNEPGIVPRGREEGKTHRVKSFEYLLDSVISYMTNLNRNSNYPGLRSRRAELKKHNLPVTGLALAPSLLKYSEQGSEYVSKVISMINYNGFDALDNASLAPTRRIADNTTILASN